MIQTCIDAIVTALTGIDGVIGAPDTWAGDIDEVASQPKQLPALFVLYAGTDFDDRKVAGGIQYDHNSRFVVVVLAASARSRADAAVVCYRILEAVRSRLIGLEIEYETGRGGELWPIRENLFIARGPLLGYALEYAIEATTEED